MKIIRSKKAMVAAGLATGLGLSAGVAYAFWTANGTGTGTASTASQVAISVNQTSTPTNLAPGGAAQALAGTFTNNTGAAVKVNSVTVAIDSITGNPGTCTAADYTLVQPSTTFTGLDAQGNVPTGTVAGWSGGSIQFNNSTTTSQDGCKGATVNLKYTVA